ncbi:MULTISPECIES: phosphonate ABC transporter, permease protein PhnE [Rhodomicrobium]|uniref:phosphonate ABC transporter, permease protein PhnE n=1 Tax=Rhodomicrobium TaxID=1068 RepID=UPI000B4B4826|nr:MULTISPECIES: phosphonate ABC transporter, permease protein PhnE [Rhodomicrobium]
MTARTGFGQQAMDLDVAIPRKALGARARGWLIWLSVAALLVWSWTPTEMYKIVGLFTDWRNMAEFAAGFTRPNFQHGWTYVREMIETVQIAIWATALAVFFGIPLAILASSNVSPWWIVQPTRRLMDAFRAIHEMVFALLFVVAVGLGPIAGVLALAIHNIGIVAKLFSEAVEAIDPRPVEGIRATGATRLQEVVFGVVPQVLPLWSSYTLYRLDTNVRSATVLGIVGAGGIGQSLYENIRSFNYSDTAAILLIIIATIVIVDMVSALIRKMLV